MHTDQYTCRVVSFVIGTVSQPMMHPLPFPKSPRRRQKQRPLEQKKDINVNKIMLIYGNNQRPDSIWNILGGKTGKYERMRNT